MMKLVPILGVAFAALAASAGLVTSATAQAPPPLNVPQSQRAQPYQAQPYPEPQYQAQPYQAQPEEFRGPRDGDWRDDRRNDDWRNDDWRGDRGRIDFQAVQRSCSRLGIQEAWNRNYYSAQYEGGPRFVEGRRGWELRGRMRLHDRSGYRTVDTACEVRRNGEAVRFEFNR